MITKFNLKTPGREDGHEKAQIKPKNKPTTSGKNFTVMAEQILSGLGGAGNISSLDNCITRLRVEVKEHTSVDEKAIKSAGVSGVIRPGKTSVQVIVGMQVQRVADEMRKLL